MCLAELIAYYRILVETGSEVRSIRNAVKNKTFILEAILGLVATDPGIYLMRWLRGTR